MITPAEQLDRKLAALRPFLSTLHPERGWLRAIRQALGMTTAQLAKRLDVSQPRIVEIEKGEADRTITLKSLERAAEALGCRVVYVLLPERPLAERLDRRALEAAERQLVAVEHTMSLEDQAVGNKKLRGKARRHLANELLRRPARLWDSP